jgi:hypothetical protein
MKFSASGAEQYVSGVGFALGLPTNWRGAQAEIGRLSRLGSLQYIGRLRTLLTLGNLKFHFVTLLKALITLGCDGTVVNKNVGTIRSSDEPITFCIVEPLHGTFHFRRTP